MPARQMLAWTAGDDQLAVQQQREIPQVRPDEVLIQVAYSGMNRSDLSQLAGHYPPPPGASDVLGLEVSGVVQAVGAEVSHIRVGDKVCALLTGGGYAQYVAVPAVQVLPVPAGMSLLAAAGICEVYATAWFNIYDIAAAQPGERILVHAAASGVGQAVLQLAKALGNPTFATAGSDEKLAQAQRLGASGTWNRRQGDFIQAVKAWGGADIILLPELGYNMKVIIDKIKSRTDAGKTYSIVAVAEGIQVHGGSTERPANYFAREIEAQTGIETRQTVLGYIQRGGSPSPADRNLGTLLGGHAAKLIHEEKYGRMAAVINNKISDIPLSEVAGRLKLVEHDSALVEQGRLMGISFGI